MPGNAGSRAPSRRVEVSKDARTGLELLMTYHRSRGTLRLGLVDRTGHGNRCNRGKQRGEPLTTECSRLSGRVLLGLIPCKQTQTWLRKLWSGEPERPTTWLVPRALCLERLELKR